MHVGRGRASTRTYKHRRGGHRQEGEILPGLTREKLRHHAYNNNGHRATKQEEAYNGTTSSSAALGEPKVAAMLYAGVSAIALLTERASADEALVIARQPNINSLDPARGFCDTARSISASL